MVLEETKERHFAAGKYTDLEIGTFVIRGDNLVLLAELVSRAPGPRVLMAPMRAARERDESPADPAFEPHHHQCRHRPSPQDEALEAAHPALEEASLTDVLAAEAESARAAASKVSWTMHDDE